MVNGKWLKDVNRQDAKNAKEIDQGRGLWNQVFNPSMMVSANALGVLGVLALQPHVINQT